MPAKSEAQRRYLAVKFGPEWMRRHHFDTKGRLPERARDEKIKRIVKGGRRGSERA